MYFNDANKYYYDEYNSNRISVFSVLRFIMFWKKNVYKWISVVVIFLMIVTSVLYIIDPVNIYGSKIIKGLNHYKIKENLFFDISKPYQYEKLKPKEVIIGSSRVYVGLNPFQNDDMYNFGQSSMSLRDLEKYVDFILKTHKPEKIYIGLDFFQFSKQNFYLHREGFSIDRLNEIEKYSDTPIMYYLKFKENMPFIHYVLDTVKYSWKNKELISCYQKGADFGRGLSSDINVSEYYYSINRFIKDYLEWQYEPESVLLLEKIINKLKNNNVEVIVFFNPMTIDLLLALDITGKIENFYYIKKKVAEFTSYYDFNYANSITENRNNFYDASHYNMKTGNIIFYNMHDTVENENVVLKCTKNDMNEIILKEIEKYNDWKIANYDYYKYLKRKIVNKKQVKEKELYGFIGF